MFSGAGLYSEGARQAGLEPIFAIDMAADAVATYNRNLPAVAQVGSVLDVREIPQADVLIAGPPCQGFSTLGRQDPLDVRNDLALAIPHWASRSGASIVVIENVPPFLKSMQWSRLASLLEQQDYAIQTWTLDSFDFGAPQLRRRSFTIASKIGALAEPKPTGKQATAGEILALPIADGDAMHVWSEPKGIAAQRIALIPPKGDKRDVMRLAPELCPPSWEKVGCQATDVWGRIDPNRPVNTLRCCFQNPSKGRYIHPTENRVISLREGARLQGVPDHWQFVGKPYPIARQIGNGVPVALGAAVMRSVAAALMGGQTELKSAA